ncbi:ATP synthase protein I [Colwellia chukchiensis]|uniref:ATP synthase protein I n=1 Tax=Colwellia chukchiensis TaxID=641665 RepID=A0A1H7PFV2_9GAMM|nr:ATP synthase subunit I [Colwellia chukchiensis]SEL34613.1 ATP synthase protein I [Colwellia chukchiensis]
MSLFIDNELAKPGRKFAFRQILIAIIVVITFCIATYFIWGLSFAHSVLAGGAISIIPNFIFAHKAFKYAGARSSEKVLDSFYSGEKLKLVLTAVLFALAFKFLAIEPIAFFSSFCLVVALPLLTPFLFKL